MGLLKFLPFNTIRNIYKDLSNAKKTKKATNDAIKKAGLEDVSIHSWTARQFLDMFTIRNQILQEQGIEEFRGNPYMKDGVEMIAFDSGIFFTENKRPVNIQISMDMETFKAICSNTVENCDPVI